MIETTAVAVSPAPGSPEWLAARRDGLGASEVPAILGLDKYKSGLDIWLEKRGLAEPRTDSPQAKVGRFAEPMIAKMYEEHTGAVLMTVPMYRHPHLPVLFASADRMVVGMDATDWLYPVEIKNRGGLPQGWGDAGTDLIPEAVAVQVHIQMMCYGLHMADVAALLGGNDFRVYRLHRDATIDTHLLEVVDAWWTRHMVNGEEPPIEGPNAARYLAQRFARHTDAVVKADEPTSIILGALADTRRERKAIETEEERLELLVKQAIGENRGIEGPAGKALWSLTKDSQSTDWKAMAHVLAALTSKLPVADRVVHDDDLSFAPDIIAQFADKFTTTKPGSRRFTFTPAKEK